MVSFSEIEVGSFFNFEGDIWYKTVEDNSWNASTGITGSKMDRCGQFGTDELVEEKRVYL